MISTIPSDLVDQKVFTRSSDPAATISQFLTNMLTLRMDVLGFIGHADLVTNQTPFFADGLIFYDPAAGGPVPLLRTPDPGAPNHCTQGPATCYTIPAGAANIPALLTTASVVFIASCDTSDTFLGWWDMNLFAGPQARVLVVPDLAAMAAKANLPAGSLEAGQVDLYQGALAWEVLAKTLGQGKTAQQAVDAANGYLNTIYPTLPAPNPPMTKLVQVIFTIVPLNANTCPRCYN